MQKTSPKSTPSRETEPNSYCSQCQPPPAACMATPSLKWDFFQFSLKQMAAKWNCISHHSDAASQSRHAVLIYLVEDFLQIPLKWLMHCQKPKPEIGGNHSPNSSPPFLGLNPPVKLVEKNHRFLHPSAPSSPLFHCSQTKRNSQEGQRTEIHLCWRMHWRALHLCFILLFNQPQAWAEQHLGWPGSAASGILTFLGHVWLR